MAKWIYTLVYLVLFVAVLSVVSSKEEEPVDCSVQRFDNCSNFLLILTQDTYIPPTSAEALEEGCRVGQDALNCVRNYASYCLESLPRTMVRLVASGAEQAQKRACTKEGIQEALSHNECITKNLHDIRICLKEMTNGFANVPSDFEIEQVLGAGCCVFDRYRSCATKVLRLSCGEETKDYFLWLTNSYTSDLFDLACVGYEDGSKACPAILEKLPNKQTTEISSFMSILLKVFGSRL